MFNLTQEVLTWRTRLEATDSMAPAALDELEEHLLVSLTGLVELGLSDEEALLIAIHRVGQPASLAAEYAKVNALPTWRRRVRWMAAGGFSLLLVQTAALTARTCGWGAAAQLGAEGTAMGWTGVTAEAAIWLAAATLLAVSLRRGTPPVVASLGAPTTFALGMGGLATLAVARQFVAIMLARAVPAEHFGLAAQTTAWTNMLVGAGVPLACIALLLWLRPVKRASAAAA